MKGKKKLLAALAALLIVCQTPPARAEGTILNHQHKLDQGTVTVPAGCVTLGEKVYTCTDPNCDYQKVVQTHVQGHHIVAGDVVQKWGCTQAQIQNFYCDVCGYARQVVIQPLGHWMRPAEYVVEPTCTTEGVQMLRCYREGCEQSERVGVRALGHDWSTSQLTTEPGERTPGERVYVCSRCQSEKRERIPPLGENRQVNAFNGLHYTIAPATTFFVKGDGEYSFTVTPEDGWAEGEDFAVTAEHAEIVRQDDGSFLIRNVEQSTDIQVTGLVPAGTVKDAG